MAFKVSVLANSFPLKVRPSRHAREEGTYVEWVERLLEKRYPGEPIQVHNFGRFLGMLHHGIASFDQAVSAIGPDVVILNYGGNECFPRYLPMWFMEFMARFRLSSHPVTHGMFRATDVGHVLIMRPIIRFFRPGGWYSLRKFRACLTRLIRMTIQESRAHVLVLNLPDVDDRVEWLIPGCRRRIVQFNDLIAEVCEEHGAAVIDLYRWIGRDFEGLLPDSFHLNAKGHRILGERVTREIVRLREEAKTGVGAAPATPRLKAARPQEIPGGVAKERALALVRRLGNSLREKADRQNSRAKAV